MTFRETNSPRMTIETIGVIAAIVLGLAGCWVQYQTAYLNREQFHASVKGVAGNLLTAAAVLGQIWFLVHFLRSDEPIGRIEVIVLILVVSNLGVLVCVYLIGRLTGVTSSIVDGFDKLVPIIERLITVVRQSQAEIAQLKHESVGSAKRAELDDVVEKLREVERQVRKRLKK